MHHALIVNKIHILFFLKLFLLHFFCDSLPCSVLSPSCSVTMLVGPSGK